MAKRYDEQMSRWRSSSPAACCHRFQESAIMKSDESIRRADQIVRVVDTLREMSLTLPPDEAIDVARMFYGEYAATMNGGSSDHHADADFYRHIAHAIGKLAGGGRWVADQTAQL
jgi:hypothetical protein